MFFICCISLCSCALWTLSYCDMMCHVMLRRVSRINCGGHASPVNFAMLATSLRLLHSWTVPLIQARLSVLTTFLSDLITSTGHSLGLSVAPVAMRCGHIMGIRVDVGVAKISLAELGRGLKEAGVLATLRHCHIRVSPYVHNTTGEKVYF